MYDEILRLIFILGGFLAIGFMAKDMFIYSFSDGGLLTKTIHTATTTVIFYFSTSWMSGNMIDTIINIIETI